MSGRMNKPHLRLKELRGRLGLSQDQFADLTNMEQSNISAIENQERVFSDKQQEYIVMRLNISPKWWETGKGPIFKENSQRTPIRLWDNMNENTGDYYKFPVFSDCDFLVIYEGATMWKVPKGSLLALKRTIQRKLPKQLLVVDGELTLHKASNPIIGEDVYRVIGVVWRM